MSNSAVPFFATTEAQGLTALSVEAKYLLEGDKLRFTGNTVTKVREAKAKLNGKTQIVFELLERPGHPMFCPEDDVWKILRNEHKDHEGWHCFEDSAACFPV